jgi:hypothetical protein
LESTTAHSLIGIDSIKCCLSSSRTCFQTSNEKEAPLPSGPLTKIALGLIAHDSGKKLVPFARILTRSLAEPLGHNARAFWRAFDWKLSLKQILSCPDLLANVRDPLAAVTRSSPMWLMVSYFTTHIVGGIGAARIGRDRLKMDSKSPKAGTPHKSFVFNMPSFCVSL